MKYLIIDTATDFMYVILSEEDKIKNQIIRPSKRDISKYLVHEIKKLLSESNVSLPDIGGIIVGKGPGSYTGIRIAGTVAKTLSYAKDIKLYEISSLFFLTSGYENVIAMIDARNNFVFGGIYHNGNTVLEDRHIDKDYLISKKMNEDVVMISGDKTKIDLNKVLKKMEEVKDPFIYEPNYVNKTEAEKSFENK